MAKFEHSFTVQPDEIDRQGHVNNVRYVQWIQDVAVAHWQHAASAEHLASVTWVVLRHEVDYLRPALVLLAQAKSIWCALDAQTLRPRRIDDQLKETFGGS